MALTKVDQTMVSDQVFGRRNLIINGAMRVAQRGTSATAMTSGGVFLIDRFKCIESSNGAATVEQSTDTPAGFAKSLKLAVTTADTDMGGGQYSQIKYVVEAQDLQRLNYGTSDAETITLSFWVKSSKTGTYCISIVKHDSTAYYYVKEYTISSANTWEKKIITITPTAGSTTLITNSAGAIADDNGDGLQLGWFLSAGTTYNGATDDAWSSNSNHYATSNQVNWMDNTSNDFYLTGVQLEVGDNATPFEHLTFGEEFINCSRYFQVIGLQEDAFGAYDVSKTRGFVSLPMLPMRGNPTGDLFNLETRYFSSANDNSWNSTSGAVFILGNTSFQYNADAVVIPTMAITVDYAGDRTDVFGLIRGKVTLDAEL